jgi:hypothetical protein
VITAFCMVLFFFIRRFLSGRHARFIGGSRVAPFHKTVLVKQGRVIIGIRLSCSLFVLVLRPEPPCVSQKWAIRENWTTGLVSGIWKRPICTYKFAMTGEFLPDQLDLLICHRALALFLAIALFFAVTIALATLALFLTIAIALAAFALALFLAITLFASVAIALATLCPCHRPLGRPPPSLPPPSPSSLPSPSPSLACHPFCHHHRSCCHCPLCCPPPLLPSPSQG